MDRKARQRREGVSLFIALVLFALFIYHNILSEIEAKEPKANSTEKSSKEAIEYLNKLREREGVKPAKWNAFLYRVAVERAEDMHRRNYYSHYDPETGELIIRKIGSGFGECIAMATDEIDAIEQFNHSLPHKEIMLSETEYAAIACRYGICVLIVGDNPDQKEKEVRING